MIAWLRKYFSGQRDFDRGFKFATGQLLEHDGDIEMLAGYVDGARLAHDYNEFDRGIEAAIRMHQQQRG